METLNKSKTNPGKHSQFILARFGDQERQILSKLQNEWYLTNSGAHLKLATSEYDYFLMKPTTLMSEMFNIDREVIVVFSPYPRFEPRTLDAFDEAQKRLSELRVETVCRVLIAQDGEVESRIEALLKTDPEQPIVIPFTYDELLSPYDDFFIRNRFRRHFYTRDLFSFMSPLKKDLYFFGRSELIQEIVNRHRSGEHTGLFGLRKSGKTSIIYAIERHLTANGERFISIDCESPSVHLLRWNELLYRVVTLYAKTLGTKFRIHTGTRYDEKHAADSFEEDIVGIHKEDHANRMLVLFDEIERISPSTGASEHWRSGNDFVYFWQTLRGQYQRHPDVFTYMIVGTNPSCVEAPVICGQENPLFSSIPSQYVPAFTVDQVRQMVRKLGRFMGLQFDELIYAKLTEDFGGHPFLIRQLCSNLHRACQGDRPAKVDRPLYEKVKKQFAQSASEYFDMILLVLQDWYPDEYDMLRFLAHGDLENFQQFALANERYTKHLVGYGLVQRTVNGYTFSIEAIRDFLLRRDKYERLNLTEEEKVAEISARRNRIEKSLRSLVRNTLATVHGRKKGAEVALASIVESRRTKMPVDLDSLFDRDDSPLYFLEVSNLILKEWGVFQNIFECDKDKASVMLHEINDFGRPDAHAKSVTSSEFQQLRLYFARMESILEAWGV